jgi:hypothetical protein
VVFFFRVFRLLAFTEFDPFFYAFVEREIMQKQQQQSLNHFSVIVFIATSRNSSIARNMMADFHCSVDRPLS